MYLLYYHLQRLNQGQSLEPKDGHLRSKKMIRLEFLRFETTLLQQPQVLQEASSQGAASGPDSLVFRWTKRQMVLKKNSS
jgi:hypothetical protein